MAESYDINIIIHVATRVLGTTSVSYLISVGGKGAGGVVF